MDTISDYIRWMGDYSFVSIPFNTLDALVLCMLSYYDLSPAFAASDGDTVYVRDCSSMLDRVETQIRISGPDRGYSEVFRLTVCSGRFGNLRMTDYVDILRPEEPLQFAAVTFRCEDVFSFIAYRGTDNSIAGWKEDFMISFTRTDAQELAREYAEQVVSGDSGEWYIGGHSKGGNLALYAACTVSEQVWSLVDHVYLLDGPGLCGEVLDLALMDRIDPKTTRIIPEFSVVGMLFEPKLSDTRIVRSTFSGLMQHCIPSWGVNHGRLATAPGNDRASRWINEVLDRWIENIGHTERIAFVNELFDALSAGGAQTLDDISGNGINGFEAVLRRLSASSEVTRKTLADLPRQALRGGPLDSPQASALKERVKSEILRELQSIRKRP